MLTYERKRSILIKLAQEGGDWSRQVFDQPGSERGPKGNYAPMGSGVVPTSWMDARKAGRGSKEEKAMRNQLYAMRKSNNPSDRKRFTQFTRYINTGRALPKPSPAPRMRAQKIVENAIPKQPKRNIGAPKGGPRWQQNPTLAAEANKLYKNRSATGRKAFSDYVRDMNAFYEGGEKNMQRGLPKAPKIIAGPGRARASFVVRPPQ